MAHQCGGRGASPQISPTCQSYGKPDLDLLSAFFRSSVGRTHVPIKTYLAESNPLRPTRCIRLERRLRCNRGLARLLPLIGIGLAIMIASATIPQSFCEYRLDFLDRHSQRLFAASQRRSLPDRARSTRSVPKSVNLAERERKRVMYRA